MVDFKGSAQPKIRHWSGVFDLMEAKDRDSNGAKRWHMLLQLAPGSASTAVTLMIERNPVIVIVESNYINRCNL